MATLERRSIRGVGSRGGYSQYQIGVYRPYRTKSGRWVWRLHGNEGYAVYGYARLLKARADLGEGSLHNTPLTAAELIAKDAAEEGRVDVVKNLIR